PPGCRSRRRTGLSREPVPRRTGSEARMSAVLAVPAVAVLSVRGATKRFGAVTALDGVDLDVYPGEVLALLGDNGAGKSTLIKCCCGALRLDSGSIAMDGVEVTIHSPSHARALGIEAV